MSILCHAWNRPSDELSSLLPRSRLTRSGRRNFGPRSPFMSEQRATDTPSAYWRDSPPSHHAPAVAPAGTPLPVAKVLLIGGRQDSLRTVQSILDGLGL